MVIAKAKTNHRELMSQLSQRTTSFWMAYSDTPNKSSYPSLISGWQSIYMHVLLTEHIKIFHLALKHTSMIKLANTIALHILAC